MRLLYLTELRISRSKCGAEILIDPCNGRLIEASITNTSLDAANIVCWVERYTVVVIEKREF